MQYSDPNDPIQLALKRELRPGERIIWSGQPIARINKSAFGIWLFAIPWTVFSVLWTAAASIPFFSFAGSGSDNELGAFAIFFPLFGVPFVAVGIGMLSMPFLPLYLARKTIFAITDQRLIRLTLSKRLKSETIPANRIGIIKRDEGRDGAGTAKVATKVGRDSDGDQTLETFDIGEVDNIMMVENAIHELVRRGARTGSV